MKTITYRGRVYLAPDWARFVATDGDGKAVGYARRPRPHEKGNFWYDGGKYHTLLSEPCADWKDSLEEIKPDQEAS